MSSIKGTKRKAPSSHQSREPKRGAKKVVPTTPSANDEDDVGFEDVENGDDDPGDEEVDAGESGLMLDPMIDPQGSSDESDDDDDNDNNEEEGEEQDTVQPTAGPSRPTTSKHLYKPPTLAEMESLQQTSTQGGATFSLQLDALLQSMLLPSAPQPALKSLLSTVHSTILSLPRLEGLPPVKAVKKIGGVPEVAPKEFGMDGVKWTLGWEKPQEILVGGSWGVVGGYKKGKGQMGGVDMVVVMPPSLFSAKDRMDYRYFHKRAYYLAVVARALQKLTTSEGKLTDAQVSWSTAGGDDRRPIVVVSAGKAQGLKHHVEIRIHASVPSTLFPLSTLYPSKSLVRSGEESTPTPLYSTSILHDTLHKSHLLHLHRLSQRLEPERTVDSFLASWRIWASKRGIRAERGGSGWFASILLGWVVDGGDVGGVGGAREKTKKVRGMGKGLGHWGALRAAWEFLAHTDFEKTPIFISASATNDDDVIPHSEMTRSFNHTFVDPTGRVNIFAEWDQGDVQLLQHHAKETLAMLEDASDRFAEVFLRSYTLGAEVFDECIRVDISSVKLPQSVSERSEHPSVDLAIKEIASILRRGLSTRARLIHISPISGTTLQIGLIFTDTATGVIDIGPSSSAPASETETFRQLWGEKAELRRFKDGTISESVVWSLSRPEDAALIPAQIVQYLLGRHFELAPENIFSSTTPEWLGIVQLPPSAREAVTIQNSEKQGFRPILSAYDDLYRLLKDLDKDLPLGILNVNPCSEMLRYSSTFVPHPLDLGRLRSAPGCLSYIPAAEVVLQFESSPKWPDDLAAIQNVKLALYHKLATVIKARTKSQVNIVFENDCTDIEDHAALEILFPQGSAFLLRIQHEKERSLLEKIAYEDEPVFATSLPRPRRRLVIPALAKHIRRFVDLPQHHSSITPLHHRYPSFSSATRLLKRWFGAHMLSTHVGGEAIELIMARVYLDPGSLGTPSSATSGFLRALDLLGAWDWKREAMFVPIFSVKESSTSSTVSRITFPTQKREQAQRSFEEMRNKEKGKEAIHPWVVVTEEDQEGLRWTKGVKGVVAARVGMLARASLEVVRSRSRSTAEEGKLDVKVLFTTPLENYDLLIHLHPSVLPRYAQSVHADQSEWHSKLQYRNLVGGEEEEEEGVKVSFDPAESFVEDLQRVYGDSILWFFDRYGGSVVGGLWNPEKEKPRAIKALLGWSSRPVESQSALVEINKDAIIAEIGRSGQGLIDKIERRR